MTKPKLDPKLEPETDVTVPTGDEAEPVAKPDNPDEARKALYKKGRENREATISREADEMPDAKAMQQAVSDAADGSHESDAFNTEDRPDRFASKSDDGEYVEQVDHEKKPEKKPKPEKEAKKPESKNLDYETVDGKVVAVINGIEYKVPEADVKEAGGLAQYQRQRAGYIALEQAATQARALAEERKKLSQPQPTATAKGEPPAKGALDKKAALEEHRKKLLKAVLEGEEADLDKVIEEMTAPRPAPEPESTVESSGTDNSGEPPASETISKNYEELWRAQSQEANTLLVTDFADVIGDPDLREIGDRKYKELRSDPANRGRLPVDMAREAGNFARAIANRGASTSRSADSEKMEGRREKKRVLPKTSQAHQRTSAPQEREIPGASDHIRRLQEASGARASRKRR